MRAKAAGRRRSTSPLCARPVVLLATCSAAAPVPWTLSSGSWNDASWSLHALNSSWSPLLRNASDVAISFLRPLGGSEVELWIMLQSLQVTQLDALPNIIYRNACAYDATPASSAGSALVYTLDATTAAVKQSRLVVTQNAPSEVLFRGTTLYIAEHDVLFSFGGWTSVTPARCVTSGASVDCSLCGYNPWSLNHTCQLPSYRTHILDLTTLTWTSLSLEDTGPGTPESALPYRALPDGMFTFGLCAVYDAALDAVLLTCGYQGDAISEQQSAPKTPGEALAPLFDFNFTSRMWRVRFPTFVDDPSEQPNSSGQMAIGSGIAMLVTYGGRHDLLVYGGTTASGYVCGGSCFVLDLDAVIWRREPSCSVDAAVRPFFLYHAAGGAAPTDRYAAVVGGKIGNVVYIMSILATDVWILDRADYTWQLMQMAPDATWRDVTPFAWIRGQLHVMPSSSSTSTTWLGWGGSLHNVSDALEILVPSEICSRTLGGEAQLLASRFHDASQVMHVITLQISAADASWGWQAVLAVPLVTVIIVCLPVVRFRRYLPSGLPTLRIIADATADTLAVALLLTFSVVSPATNSYTTAARYLALLAAAVRLSGTVWSRTGPTCPACTRCNESPRDTTPTSVASYRYRATRGGACTVIVLRASTVVATLLAAAMIPSAPLSSLLHVEIAPTLARTDDVAASRNLQPWTTAYPAASNRSLQVSIIVTITALGVMLAGVGGTCPAGTGSSQLGHFSAACLAVGILTTAALLQLLVTASQVANDLVARASRRSARNVRARYDGVLRALLVNGEADTPLNDLSVLLSVDPGSSTGDSVSTSPTTSSNVTTIGVSRVADASLSSS